MTSVSRSGWLLTVAAASSLILLGPRWRPLSSPSDFGATLVDLAIAVQLIASVWVLVSCALVVLARRQSWAQQIVAVAVPRALHGLLIVSVSTGFSVAAAHADSNHADSGRSLEGGLSGLTLPDRPLGSTPAATRPSQVAFPDPVRITHTVQRGDTLWAIAAQSIPPDASRAQIAQSCARWYHSNRATIGSNPDLILPGMRLLSPASPPLHQEPS